MTARPRQHMAPLGPRLRTHDLVRITGAVGLYRVRQVDFTKQEVTLAHLSGAYAGQYDLGLVIPMAGGVHG